MPVILATRDYARWLGERGHLRKNPGMNSVMTLGVVLAVFRFDAAVAQEGYLGQDHDKWHHSFYQTLKSVLQSYRLSLHLRETGAKRERSTRHR